MMTKEQILSGCELWVAGYDGVFLSSYNTRPISIRMHAVGGSGYFASREEAEEWLLKHLLERLNDN